MAGASNTSLQSGSHPEALQEPDLWRKTSIADLSGQLELRSMGCKLALLDIYVDVLEG